MSDATAFEAALHDNPDDVATWCAFADWLAEQGDPRGQFMQVQIALEDESRAKDERDALKAREAELLAEHQSEWLGELAPFVLDRDPQDANTPRVRFARGWVAEVAGIFTVERVRAIGRSPQTQFLTRLLIDDVAYESSTSGGPRAGFFSPGPDVPAGDYPEALALHALLHCPRLA
ncbi:MAG: TIGR02996 domain-containing protein, partial [Gemmataceae bacterium]|nr:TIGR02996 domain-containing protein [Gemmataceae bacterium]